MTIERQSRAASAPTTKRRGDHQTVPALVARPGGAAERFADALGDRHPALVFALALLGGFLVLAAASILLALLVVHVLVSGSGLGLAGTEELQRDACRPPQRHAHHVLRNRLAGRRRPGPADPRRPHRPRCAVLRRWLIAAFAVFVLLAESATYRITSIVVPRDRPSVHRLEDLPVDASYPSGHTAASVAVYSGLVLLLTTRFTSSLSKALAWTGAILLTTFVALSRMYQGMHHPLDVAGGVVVGIGAILVLLFACRAAGAAAERRS